MSTRWLLIGLGYVLIALVVVCFGAFGIAVTKWDRHFTAYQTMSGTYHPEALYQSYLHGHGQDDGFKKDLHTGAQAQSYQYRTERMAQIWATIFVSLFWPVGVPIYLSVKKGHMVADELARRDAA